MCLVSPYLKVGVLQHYMINAAAEDLTDEVPSTAALRLNERLQAHGRTTNKECTQSRQKTGPLSLGDRFIWLSCVLVL